ncbi:amidohydrolase family protein [Amphritea pacifica]|uniref:Amidohydrolase family protein n=1 Tax=Amphritea pacifica TaxID=2811233 RepID=A0ABS2WBJ7_9GAMM|nr:amidohydrolase family protein [Amphritea pacifica]
MWKFLEPASVNDLVFTALLEHIDSGNCYVKLAGCYETSKSGPPHYEDLAAISKALINHAPDRIIRGSNWPHVSLPPEQSPDNAELLDLFCSWVPDQATLKKIFGKYPSKLYGFCAGKQNTI